MPSVNRYVPIHEGRRLRVNTCEGSVGIVNEQRDGHGKWKTDAMINLSREDAERLIAQITDQMAKNF